jgi:hypothetical protein
MRVASSLYRISVDRQEALDPGSNHQSEEFVAFETSPLSGEV